MLGAMARLSRVAPELPVLDLKRSLEYYEQMLGFRIAMEFPGGDYAIVERDDVAIHLFEDASRDHSPVGVHIFTEELDALDAELEQRGAHVFQPIIRKPWGTRDILVYD